MGGFESQKCQPDVFSVEKFNKENVSIPEDLQDQPQQCDDKSNDNYVHQPSAAYSILSALGMLFSPLFKKGVELLKEVPQIVFIKAPMVADKMVKAAVLSIEKGAEQYCKSETECILEPGKGIEKSAIALISEDPADPAEALIDPIVNEQSIPQNNETELLSPIYVIDPNSVPELSIQYYKNAGGHSPSEPGSQGVVYTKFSQGGIGPSENCDGPYGGPITSTCPAVDQGGEEKASPIKIKAVASNAKAGENTPSEARPKTNGAPVKGETNQTGSLSEGGGCKIGVAGKGEKGPEGSAGNVENPRRKRPRKVTRLTANMPRPSREDEGFRKFVESVIEGDRIRDAENIIRQCGGLAGIFLSSKDDAAKVAADFKGNLSERGDRVGGTRFGQSNGEDGREYGEEEGDNPNPEESPA